LDLEKGKRHRIRSSPQPNEASLEVSRSGISEGHRETHQSSQDKMHFRSLRKEICSLRKPQPLKSLFSASLATTLHTHTHKYTFVPSPPLLLCYFCLGQYFSVKAAAALWADASPPHPERGGRLSFLTSLRKSCNCSFLSLPLTTGVYIRNPGDVCLTPPLISGASAPSSVSGQA